MKKKEQEKYDPEDIESLMIHKSFTDLYPEERTFVLKHLDSELEYESMRKTLISVQSRDRSDRISPPPSMKKELMAMMEKDKKKGFVIWLNGFFPFVSEGSRVPAFAMGGLGLAVLVIAVVFLFPAQEEQRFAELEDKFKQENTKQQEQQNEEKSQAEGELNENKTFEEAQMEDLNEAKSSIEEARLNEEGNVPNAGNAKSLDMDELRTAENNDYKAEAKDQEAFADSDVNFNLTQADQSISGNAATPKVDLIEAESVDEYIADASSPVQESKEKVAKTPPASIQLEERDLNSEFHFDNQMGNAMDLRTEELSEVTIASAKINQVETSVEETGALFDSNNRLVVSAKANESLPLIDALYTAY